MIIESLKNFIFKIRLKNAIKKANELKKLTFYKYYVIKSFDKPVIITKKRIKVYCRNKKIKLSDFKKFILYETI